MGGGGMDREGGRRVELKGVNIQYWDLLVFLT